MNHLCSNSEGEREVFVYQPNHSITRVADPSSLAFMMFDWWTIAGAVASFILQRAAKELIDTYVGPELVRIHGESITQIALAIRANIEDREREYFETEVKTAQDKLSIYQANPGVHQGLLDDIANSMINVSNHFERIGVAAIGGWVHAVNLAIAAYVIKAELDPRYLASAKEIARLRIPAGRDLVEATLQHNYDRVSGSCLCERKYDGTSGWRWHCRHYVDGQERRVARTNENHARDACRSDRVSARDRIMLDARNHVTNPAEACINDWQSFVESVDWQAEPANQVPAN